MKEITDFYLSVFKDAKLLSFATISDTPSGTVETASLEIFGQRFDLMTAGPMFKFNEAVSFLISCKDQTEIDYYWDSLIAGGGAESQCGWLKDRYGLSWQIVPSRLNEMMSTGTKEQVDRVTATFLKMKKFDLAALEEAFKG